MIHHWKHGSYNDEKIYGVQVRMPKHSNQWWLIWKKYKTMQSCLQACRDLRKDKMFTDWEFRPIHIYYEK